MYKQTEIVHAIVLSELCIGIIIIIMLMNTVKLNVRFHALLKVDARGKQTCNQAQQCLLNACE